MRQSPKPMNSLPPYLQTFSPSSNNASSPHHHHHHHHNNHHHHHRSSSSSSSDLDKYLSELLSERQKLGPFMQVLPNCSRLLNQEIMRLTSLVGTSSFGDHDILDPSLLSSGGMTPNGTGFDCNGWSSFQSDRLVQQASAMALRGFPGGSPGPMIKRIIRIEVPIEKYPNFNFVGRLLGPRGNSLKRVESTTGCRVFIRGRGSVRDTDKEEQLRDKPGYEHLNEQLHVLIEAEQPANVIDLQLNKAREIIEDLLKPVDETHDYFKKQQLRELAMLNGTLREESPSNWSGSVSPSPFSNSGMKRAKTRG